MSILLAIVIGYTLGCVHGSQIVGLLKNIDIKNAGVKNAGASNTTLLLGWKYGILVAIIDIGKAAASLFLFQFAIDLLQLTYEPYHLFILCSFVIIGHNYPITMGFKGGKGTASFIGMLFALDWKVGCISFLILLILTLTSDYLVIGVVGLYASSLILFFIFKHPLNGILCVLALFLLSTYKHRENYKRIIEKKETRISSLFSKKKKDNVNQ